MPPSRPIRPLRRAAPLVALLAATLLAPPAAIAQRAYPASAHGGNYMHNFYFPPAPSSSPWYPAWHPGGERVAVAMSGSIWEVDIASGDAFEIVHGSGYLSSPNYSPDGPWLIYTVDDGGGTIDLEVMNRASGERHRLTEGAHIHTDPRFSPGGDRIAYVTTAPSGYFNVHIRPFADGAWTGPAIEVTSDNAFGRDRLLIDRLYFGPWDMHISPAWLPSGEELLLVSNRDVALGSGNVYRVPARANGIDERQVVLSEQTLYRTQPHVSYDGKRFVYSSTAGAADQFQNIYVQPTIGGEPYKMTFFDFDAFHPRWSPDAEWIAFVANEGGLPQLFLLEANGGRLRRVEVLERHWARPTGTLAVTTVDEEGQVASRIHLVASDGKFYAPANAYARVSRAGDRIFHHPGSFTVELPAGRAEVTVVRGFETIPVTLATTVRANETTALTVALEEISDLSGHGWFSGSTHVHMNYAGNLRNSLPNLMMMSAAEDQDVVAEQVANKDNRILDHQYWLPGGGAHPLSEPGRLLVVGQEYRPPFYGHVYMFGHREHLISPYAMGYEGTAIESLYPSNTDMLLKAKAQGATTAYVHSFYNGDPLEGNLGGAKGFIVDAALAAADAVEWSTPQNGWPPVYAVWSNGIRAVVVGGEDSISSLHATPLLGSMRTYVRTPDGTLTAGGWFRALRDGHSFVSSGPLIDFTVGGRGPGEELDLDAPGEVRLRGRVWSLVPFERVELIVDGQVVRIWRPTGDRKALTIDEPLAISASGWVHLRVEGARADRWPLDTAYPQAFTNPVWVTVAGRPIRSAEAAAYALRWIDKLQTMAEEWPGWRSGREREHVFAQFEAAREVYRRRGAEAAGATTLQALEPGEERRESAPPQPTVIEQESGTGEVLQAVSPVSAETVWVSGHGGAILRTLDGGGRWERVQAPGGDSLQFRDIHAFSSRAAVAMTAGTGSVSRIYRTADAGASWRLAFLMNQSEGFLDCIDFWDAARGFAYGDSFDGAPYILVTGDGGRSWTRVGRDRMPAAGEGEGGFAASGTCARTGDGGHGWIGTGAGESARILATEDFGATWWSEVAVPMSTGESAGIFTLAVDAGRPVMALGGDLGRAEEVVAANAAASVDGGRSWTATVAAPIAGAVYGSAAGGAFGARRVVAVAPPGAAFTADMGASWQRIPEVSAWAVEFANGGRVGWAAGGGGRIWRIEW